MMERIRVDNINGYFMQDGDRPTFITIRFSAVASIHYDRNYSRIVITSVNGKEIIESASIHYQDAVDRVKNLNEYITRWEREVYLNEN